MTGTREIPNILGASQEQDQLAYDVMGDSWGAKVILDETSQVANPGVPPAGPARRPLREVITLAEQQADYAQMLQDKLAGQESFEIYMADAVGDIIAPEALRPWLTNLWPLACQTCGEPLGSQGRPQRRRPHRRREDPHQPAPLQLPPLGDNPAGRLHDVMADDVVRGWLPRPA